MREKSNEQDGDSTGQGALPANFSRQNQWSYPDSELDEAALRDAGMTPTTVRCAVGDEDPIDLILHFVHAARASINPSVPGYTEGFMSESETRELIRHHYIATHTAHVESHLERAGSSDWF